MEKKYIILPSCDDTNRGDQALVWETVDLAKSSGFAGDYYLITEKDKAKQSIDFGLFPVEYVLSHPSSNKKKGSDNRKYSLSIVIQWAFRSIMSLIYCAPLLTKVTRKFFYIFLSKEKKQTVNIISQCSAAFVKGGGFLHDYGGTIIEKYKVFFLLYHIRLALSFGVPVYVMPNSFGPFKSRYSKKIVEKTLRKCKLVYSRESISKEMLSKLCHIDSILSFDLANYLLKDENLDVDSLFKNNKIEANNKKIVGITVRPYRFPGYKDPAKLYYNYKLAIAETIKWLKSNDYYPVLIEHVFAENTHEQDMICIKEIKEMLGFDDTPVFSDLSLNCKQIKSVYGEIDYLIGTRFHSVIFSMTQKKPCIAIAYGGNKGEGIMKDIGLSKYSINIANITSKELIDCFSSLVMNEKQVLESVEHYINKIDIEKNKIIKELKQENESSNRIR